ncbi:MAG: hypothetical protein J5535_03950 [Firmicutes bacterium]|nr:hypothetical protein [Bacillota bacterium]
MKNRKKRVKIIIPAVIIVLAAAALLFFLGRPGGTVPQGSGVVDPNAVSRAGDSDSFASIGENAWFYYDGHLVKYYDPALKKSFVLCSRSNCLHTGKNCEAWFGNDVFGESAIAGVAAEGNYVYVMSTGETEGSFDRERPVNYQIIRIDPSDGTRKVVAEFNNKMYDKPGDGKEYLINFDCGNVYVCNGIMWFRTQYMSTPGETVNDADVRWTQNIGVDLNSGKTINIGSRDYECRILTMGSGYVTYVHDEYDDTVLMREEFYEQLTEKGRVEYNGSTYNDYTDFLNAVKRNSGVTSKYYLYHLNDGTTEELFESKTVQVPALFDPSVLIQESRKTIFGSHNDLLLIREYLPDGKGEYSLRHIRASLYNIKDGSLEQFFESENGYIPSTMLDGLNGILADGSVIIYQYSEDGSKTEDWVYNVETKELRYIAAKEDVGYSFRPEGIWNGGFIGTVYQLNGFPEGAHGDYFPMSYAWISREDYLSGNMNALVRYKIK